jgi:hypothetical protein
MSYKFSTGSLRQGDIYYEDDRLGEPTYIDFGMDTITLRPSGSQILHATSFAVGIGTTSPDPDELLTIDGVGGEHEANIQFREDGANRSKIGVNDSDNLVFHNQTVNKHIVFKVNDQGVTREGMRVDGATAAVVVNEGSESLVDFRVESDTNTHMLFVDGSANKVGVNNSTPGSGLDVNSSFATAITSKQQDYTLTATDHTVLVNCSGGNVTITLPTAVGCAGRMYIIKRTDTSANSVNIDANGSEQIDGSTSLVGVAAGGSIVLQSDNSGWWKVAEYINPP